MGKLGDFFVSVAVDRTLPTKPLTDAAKRALAEAEARKKAAADLDLPPELGGRDGPEPIRFGDWEKTCRGLPDQMAEDMMRVAVVGPIKSYDSFVIKR